VALLGSAVIATEVKVAQREVQAAAAVKEVVGLVARTVYNTEVLWAVDNTEVQQFHRSCH